jgi:2,4-dienoyl-CoA reductase-like NADH-dependent reductase (Old Yellow Enzyme family)/thioredoxin reductase
MTQRPGEKQLSRLFEPVKWNKFEIKNRVKYGACCVSNYNTRDGFVTARELARTKVLAGTGCGIITNQGAYPDPLGEGKAYFSQIGLFDDKFLPQFEKVAGYIHEAGAVAIQQILHAGRYGGIDLGYCVQPSVVPQTLPHFRPPRELTKEQIRETIRQHADAAKRAIKAGFDGTEITSFMGYLLASFNSKFTNRRTDEYGGSPANRGRFMREMIDAIKQATPDNPLVIRLNGAELMDQWGGSDEEECLEMMKQAADCGVDMISVTVGWQEAPESSIGRDVPPGHWNYLAARAKKHLPNAAIAFGVRLPDPIMANQCLVEGQFDFWEVCRPLLADPELLHKAAEGRLDEVRRCVGTLNCLSRLFRDLPYTCTMNPALGREVEPEYHIRPAARRKKIMIVGAGPAGIECAMAARRRGHDVSVFERSDKIGGSLAGYAAHDLAHKDDLASVVKYYSTMAKKLDLDMRLNTDVTSKLMREVLHQFDAAVIATGARFDTLSVPAPEASGMLVDAREVALGKVRPAQKVVVLGGNEVGLTLAESLKTAGHDVAVVEPAKRIAANVVPAWKWRHTAWIEELQIPTYPDCQVVAIGKGTVTIRNGKGKETQLAADMVIAASPARANQELVHELEWSIDELHTCGDASSPRGLTQAIHDGYRLGCQI